jgi:fumarate reductase subunit D
MTGRALDRRARSHPAYRAYLMHRWSGLALALFLPLHFTLLAQALHGTAALDRGLQLTASPLAKLAEWGLVTLLALHLTGGTRLLLIEFGPWRGLRQNWIAAGFGLALATGMAFALALIN